MPSVWPFHQVKNWVKNSLRIIANVRQSRKSRGLWIQVVALSILWKRPRLRAAVPVIHSLLPRSGDFASRARALACGKPLERFRKSLVKAFATTRKPLYVVEQSARAIPMRSFELGRKTAVDGPAETRSSVALRDAFARRPRPPGRHFPLPPTAQRSGRKPFGPAGFRAPSPGREGGTPKGRKHRPAAAKPRHGRGMMRIERRYTKAGQSPYADDRRSARRPARSATRTARSSSASRTSRCREAWCQVATDVLAQKYFRKAGVPARLKKVEENGVPSWLWRSVPDEAGARGAARERALRLRDVAPSRCSTASPAAGPTGAGRAAISTARRTPAPSTTSCASCSPRQMAAPNSPQWFNTGLHWAYGIDGPGQGHYYVDHRDRQADQVDVGLRASAAARLLHPVRRRRPRQRGRHHGPVGARGAPVQVRLRHRLELLAAARRGRAALGRRPVVRPDVASSRSATARRAPSSRAARRAARPRWWWSTSTIPTSRSTSTGRCARSRRSPRSSPARGSARSTSRPS